MIVVVQSDVSMMLKDVLITLDLYFSKLLTGLASPSTDFSVAAVCPAASEPAGAPGGAGVSQAAERPARGAERGEEPPRP